MTSITADNSLAAFFQQAQGNLIVRDGEGKILGFYSPLPPEQADFYAKTFPANKTTEELLEETRADFDLAAIEREMATNDKWYTLAEVYEHLLAITPEPGWRAYLEEKIAHLKERDQCPTP